MPLDIIIDHKGDLRSLVKRHSSLLVSREGYEAAGVGASEAWRQHFYQKNKTPNKLGGKRTNYWAKAGDSVNFRIGSDGKLIVAASQLGIRQRYQGGEIRAKNSKLLTIPVAAEAHGKRAGEFGDTLSLIRAGKGRGTQLVLAKTKDGSEEIKVYYVLKRSVYQEPDRDVVPEAEIVGAARSGFMNLVVARTAQAEGRYS